MAKTRGPKTDRPRGERPPAGKAPAGSPGPGSPEGVTPVGLGVDILLGWFIPGAGHLSRGFRRQGMIVLGVVVPLFVAGLWMSDLEAVSRELHPYAFYAELGVAGGTLPLLAIRPAEDKILQGRASVGTYQDVPPLNDTGVLFCCIAGLLNLLALFDLADRSLSPPPTPGAGRTRDRSPDEAEGSPA